MLTREEFNAVVDALHVWAERCPAERSIGFLQSGGPKTPQQIVMEVKERTDDGEAILEMLEHSIRREGLDRVVSRLKNERV